MTRVKAPQVVERASTALEGGQWQAAIDSCLAGEKANPNDCDAAYCEFIARTMLVVDQINAFLLPRYRRPLMPMAGDVANLQHDQHAPRGRREVGGERHDQEVPVRRCPSSRCMMGDAADPVLRGEVRGLWTTRDAHMVAALLYSMSYGLEADFNPQPVPPPPPGETVPALLAARSTPCGPHLLAQQQLLFSQPADPARGSGRLARPQRTTGSRTR